MGCEMNINFMNELIIITFSHTIKYEFSVCKIVE